MQKEVLYLGYVISAAGVKPDPHKLSAVLDFPIPSSTKELKQFLGFTNYYRKFIYHYADIAAPLHNVLSGCKKSFQWTVLVNMHLMLLSPS